MNVKKKVYIVKDVLNDFQEFSNRARTELNSPFLMRGTKKSTCASFVHDSSAQLHREKI